MIEVTVVLYATLTRYHPEGGGNAPFTVQLEEGSTVSGLVEHLGIGGGEVKQVFIRHRSRPGDFLLEDRERVAVFPPVAGG